MNDYIIILTVTHLLELHRIIQMFILKYPLDQSYTVIKHIDIQICV